MRVSQHADGGSAPQRATDKPEVGKVTSKIKTFVLFAIYLPPAVDGYSVGSRICRVSCGVSNFTKQVMNNNTQY